MKSTARHVPGLVLLLGLFGCDLVGPENCTRDARPGITITLNDSISGLLITGNDVVATVTDGLYSDTGSPNSGGQIALAYERGGSYGVEVTATGYRRWVRSNVRVMEGECHVRTVELLARMQR